MPMFEWMPQMVTFMRAASEYGDYYQQAAAQIIPYLSPGAHICDAGCGLGYLSQALSPHAGRVTAIDRNANALAVLQESPSPNVEPVCGEIEKLSSRAPYDAMVFCFFGNSRDILRIARQQCRGDVFVFTRNYRNHRFSAQERPRPAGGCDAICQLLRRQHIPFERRDLELEFGQPLRNIEEARAFYHLYTRDRDPHLADVFLRQRLRATGRDDYPIYLPHIRQVGFLHWKTESALMWNCAGKEMAV